MIPLTINRLISVIISIFYLFTIKIEYFVNENLHISADQLPILMPKCALQSVNLDVYSETFFFNSLLFSLVFFFFFFFLTCFVSSNFLIRYSIYLIVLLEFCFTRYICFFYIHLNTQLILIRLLRFLSVSLSLFLLFFCCKYTRRYLIQPKPITKKKKSSKKKKIPNYDYLLTGFLFSFLLVTKINFNNFFLRR